MINLLKLFNISLNFSITINQWNSWFARRQWTSQPASKRARFKSREIVSRPRPRHFFSTRPVSYTVNSKPYFFQQVQVRNILPLQSVNGRQAHLSGLLFDYWLQPESVSQGPIIGEFERMPEGLSLQNNATLSVQVYQPKGLSKSLTPVTAHIGGTIIERSVRIYWRLHIEWPKCQWPCEGRIIVTCHQV